MEKSTPYFPSIDNVIRSERAMKKIDFSCYLESVGKEFQARSEQSSFYQHPTGTGDAREDVVREYLRQILSPRFCVDRGKVFDSGGLLSREFDVIVSESNDVAPAMYLAGRRIVPIEAVYGIIEVKSSLTHDQYCSFVKSIQELNGFTRQYQPATPLLNAHDKMKIKNGVKAQDQIAGKIWSGIVAFDSPSDDAIKDYLTHHCDGFIFLCVPGKKIVVLNNDRTGIIIGEYGNRSLPSMVWIIMAQINSNTRPRKYIPNFDKYRETIIEQIVKENNTRLISFEKKKMRET